MGSRSVFLRSNQSDFKGCPAHVHAHVKPRRRKGIRRIRTIRSGHCEIQTNEYRLEKRDAIGLRCCSDSNAMKGGQGLLFFSGSWGKFPGRNHRTGGPALQLRASSEQVTNYQFRTTPNILAIAFCQVVSEPDQQPRQNHHGYH
jgi:hypothetical protein